ncbi:Beta-galactosidase 11 [Armadillidium nasatum]|uniref:Beta-galactosidase 11 n=1 Tax=Armadillidium nasatum TaxID=96803 RepID=A0A5N5T9Y4_9CRUS|nr:Beta-galactosidase 11 [Armadillidium nasatum]
MQSEFLFRNIREPKIFAKAAPTRKTFEIDPHTKGFLKDGKPFRYISGTIHYFRVLPDDWRDRLRKLKFAGFNTVETYIEWSSHEPEPGVYNFEGGLDLFSYLDLAFEEGLLVILRPGPFIDAGRDMHTSITWTDGLMSYSRF